MLSNTQSFLLVLTAAALAPIIAGIVGMKFKSIVLPVVVVELLLGVVIGPQVLGLAHTDDVLNAFSQLGLGFLFFFAGYEIRMEKIKGEPLRLAGKGWLLSLAIAYGVSGILHATNIVISDLLVGSALVTTAIGTLIPILRDENRLGGEFGRQMLAIGAVGEFGPVMIVTLLLGATSNAAEQSVLLIAFVVVAVLTGLAATGAASRWFEFVTARMDNSGQLPVRLAVLLVFGLVVIAGDLGMDVILGAFAAGMIMAMVIGDRDASVFDSKMEAVGFGFLIPFFFIISGMNLDIEALFGSLSGALKLPLFFVLMLVVRGVPALLFYRKVLPANQLKPLGLLSATQLPIVVAITSIGLENGNMRPSTAAALVGAAVLTVLIFPTIALRMLKQADAENDTEPEPEASPA
ncbi:MAG: cation:proton antiporter [Thermoleophilaceae bacterium]|nr:cation:proton antiporter [Thermoleophilaceae bacterium]